MPKYVWEVKCADLTMSTVYCASMNKTNANKGIAMRFPRFVRERDDKKINQATTSDQLFEFYKRQGIV